MPPGIHVPGGIITKGYTKITVSVSTPYSHSIVAGGLEEMS